MSPCCWRWAGHAAVCKWELTSTPSTFFPLTHYSSYLQAERHLERTRVTTDRQPQHFSSTDEFGCFKNKKACSHLNFRWKLHLPFNNYLYLPSWLYFFFFPFLKWHAPRLPLNGSHTALLSGFHLTKYGRNLLLNIISFGVADLFKLVTALPFSLNQEVSQVICSTHGKGKSKQWALLESQIFHRNEIFLHVSLRPCFQSLLYRIPLALASREAEREFNPLSFNTRINLPKIIYTQPSFKRTKLALSLSSWCIKLQTPKHKTQTRIPSASKMKNKDKL